MKRFIYRKRREVPLITSQNQDLKLVRRVHGRHVPRLRQFLYIKRILSAREKAILLISVIVFFTSSLWLLFSVTSKYLIEVPAVGGEYVEGIVGSPSFINPIFASLNDVDNDLVRLIYSGLMRYDHERRLVPDLAVNYRVSDDKKVYTFNLKQNVVWHDNEPLKADDVVFTIKLLQDPEVGSPLLVSFQGIDVIAVDEYTVEFRLQEPFQSFLSSLTVGILPEHIWSSITPDKMRFAQRNFKPIGSGPFIFKRLLKDEGGYISRVELSSFEQYYHQRPFIEKFSFVFFPEYEGPNGIIQAIREQKIQGMNFVPFNLREKVKRKHINLHTLQLPQYSALFFNQSKLAVLKDKNLRLALAIGLDKKRVLRETLANEGEIINGPILRGFPGFDEAFSPYEYSVDEANSLLDKTWTRVEAEVYRKELKEKIMKELQGRSSTSTEESVEETAKIGESDAETQEQSSFEEEAEKLLDEGLDETQLFYRKDKEGEILEINLMTADTPEYKKAAYIIAGAWQELGIKTSVEFVSTKEISKVVLHDRNYEVLLYGVIVGSDPDQYPFWHSTQIDHPGLNLSGYLNRKADELLEKIREVGNAEDAGLYGELQKLIVDDMPAVFLYAPTYTYLLSDRVLGFNVMQISHPSDRFADVTQWFIDTKRTWKIGE